MAFYKTLIITLLFLSPQTLWAKRDTIYLQPLGAGLKKSDILFVQQTLVDFSGLKVKILPQKSLPKVAYYPPRKRYRAEIILDELQKEVPADGLRVLGLTAKDISTTKGKYKDWGVIGLAYLSGRVCVISSFRCKKKAKNAHHALIRFAKTAVHEIGHTLGLEHCPHRGCLMEDAKGKVRTSDREYDFCKQCRARLKRNGYNLPQPKIPWPKP